MIEPVQQELPLFSGVDTRCLKCGFTHASMNYIAHGYCDHFTGRLIETMGGVNERLHRTCQLCGYMWDEAVLA